MPQFKITLKQWKEQYADFFLHNHQRFPGTFVRTIAEILYHGQNATDQHFVVVNEGKVHFGLRSKHRTESGVKYNRLWRLYARI